MVFNAVNWIGYAWAVLGIFWILGMLFNKPAVRSQTLATRVFHVALGALGFALLGTRWFERGWMGMPIVPGGGALTHNAQLVGLAVTVAGCLFAVSARIVLGANWSASATVKRDHELLQQGSYAVARHPIYSGLLLAVLGTALAIGEWRCIVGIVTILIALAVKMSQEERLMMQTFPEAYPRYKERVRALIPGVF